MKGKLLYLLLLAATVFWGLLYYSSALISLAVLEVLAAAVSWTVMRFQISKIKVRICMPLSVTEKGERMEAGLELENNSRIPLVRAETQIRLKNLFYPETETIRLTGAVDAKSRVRILRDLWENTAGRWNWSWDRSGCGISSDFQRPGEGDAERTVGDSSPDVPGHDPAR